MTYFLLQSGAMFLAAYFVGCWCGCLVKSIGLGAAVTRRPLPVAAAAPAMAKAAPSVQAVSEPHAAPRAAQVPAAPAVQVPLPGSRVAPVATAAASAAAAGMSFRPGSLPVGYDDLKRIKGIGPEIERKLNAAGIRRYSEIASWAAADVVRANGLIGQDGRIQHENWIEQAQILAKGGETAFSRRMDRREVADGSSETWTPTAPNQVARQAAAASQGAQRSSAEPPVNRPAFPVATTSAAAAASATAAAGALAASTTAAARAPIVPLPPKTPPAAPQPAAPATPAPGSGISMRPAPGQGNQRRFVRLAAPEGKSDELSLISGVEETIAGELNRYGIYHYWQLAAMGPDDIDYLESRLALRGRMRREEWQEQALELMAGKPPRGLGDRHRAAHAQDGPPAAPGQTAAPPASASPVRSPASTVAQNVTQAPVQTHAPHAHARPPASQQTNPPAQRPVQTQAPAATTQPSAPQRPAVVAAAVATGLAGATTAAMPPAPPVTSPVPPPAKPIQTTAAPQVAEPVRTPPPPLAPPRPPVQPAPVQAAPVQSAPIQVAPVQTAPPPPPPAPAAGADAAANPGWLPRSRASNAAARGARDDLKRIKGIGVVIDKKLEAMGTTTYGQIAAWTTADVDRVSNALDFKGRIEREQWVEQARILGGGGQTDFSRRMDKGDGTVPTS